jgi:SAM-dependent methyltransferase
VVLQTVGYATDVPYLRTFFHELAPAWLDHVAVVTGFVPPVRDGGFAFCDLGCGQGVTTTILAATHPKGNFYGIDAMPSHIEHARRFAAEGAIANVDFHAADFETATSMELPGFDYIVAHGVYSWVNAESQAALRAFIDRYLKPGGLVYISYNAVPGRMADQPFQRLVQGLGSTFDGDSTARYRAAAKIMHRIADLKPPALAASPFLKELRKNKKRFSEAYLVHELMTENWKPLSVTEVRSAMASIGLAPVGSATLIENFESLVLRRAARKVLNTISDINARELARDFLINQFFRRDVFARAGRRLDEKARRRRLRETTFSLACPRRAIKYTTITSAGRLKYGNAAARRIVSVLSAGPASLAEVVAKSNLDDQDMLANVLVLCAAGAVWPVESHAVSVSALNQAIRRRLGGSEEIRYLALPCGTALEIEDACRGLLDGKRRKVAEKHGDWLKFLVSHNISPDEIGKA